MDQDQDLLTLVTRISQVNNSKKQLTQPFISAIIYKDTLFVLFGINDKGELTDEGFFLNINNYTWIPAYPHPLPDYGGVSTGSGFDNNSKNNGGGLDAKSIIGISIGSVLVVNNSYSQIKQFVYTLIRFY